MSFAPFTQGRLNYLRDIDFAVQIVVPILEARLGGEAPCGWFFQPQSSLLCSRTDRVRRVGGHRCYLGSVGRKHKWSVIASHIPGEHNVWGLIAEGTSSHLHTSLKMLRGAPNIDRRRNRTKAGAMDNPVAQSPKVGV